MRLAVLLAVLLFGGPASAASDLRRFDIPAQSLAAALAEFADRTGMAALIDAEAASGKTSSTVKGRLLPDEALRILLAGTDLSFRRVNDAAFAVGPNTSGQTIAELPGHHRRDQYDGYFARIQELSIRSLCVDPPIDLGVGRVVVQVWIGPAGAVDAVHPVTIQPDDQAVPLTERLLRLRVPPPPVGLPQPVTMLLRSTAAGGHCANGSPAAP